MNKYGFVNFCKNNNDVIINSIKTASVNMPPKMNNADYRFHISSFFCRSLTRSFDPGQLRPEYSVGYDLLYGDYIKISVKIQQILFQRHRRNTVGNNELTTPKNITMKNCLGGYSSDKIRSDFDFLMAIQRGKVNNGIMEIGYGIISAEKINSSPSVRMDLFSQNTIKVVHGDQINIRIENSQFDYYSGLVPVELSDSKNRMSGQNEIFSMGLTRVYDELLGLK